ncbi:transcriptional regulator, XRE family with cupin sensor [Dyadobacter koreensis]|uniref:Transcriptional regulator, XRE family with cupin sensor n=1 Tax=Dyadobacter koreensis TaxID=408657 RepID=A0A1H6XUA5_9BACT|nr:XRE family transcriptional regulator [Dyadobacter koreensis]SEJ32611.1 transcriptional regulator, XRE family with cupin sensor [Dyadobacter koreensis]
MEGAFLLEVSRRIKEKRIEKKLTLQELADKSSVSKGLISQIENGRSIPSLPVMFSIIQSLEMDVGDFFKDLNLIEPTIILQKRDDYESFEKENTKGFNYQRIFTKSLQATTIDFVLLELLPDSHREEVYTEAFEFKYILSGQVDYLINGDIYSLSAGDSLFFDGRLPHVPKNKYQESCHMLIVYFFHQK